MRKIILTITFSILFSSTALADAKWEIVQQPFVEKPFFDVHFVNEKEGWAVGMYQIVHSDNGGVNWNIQFYDRNVDFDGMYFLNDKEGWVVGGGIGGKGGIILHTTDGGKMWDIQWRSDKSWFSIVDFASDKEGWVVGADGFILHTSDGGKTWDVQVSGTDESLYDVSFINVNVGWAVGGGGTILKTDDGGITWRAQNIDVRYQLQGCYFFDANNGWIVGFDISPRFGVLLKTNDGGTTWQKREIKNAINLWDIYFLNEQEGWVAGDKKELKSLLLHTVDGGITWEEQNTGPGNSFMHLSSIYFLNEKKGWAVTWNPNGGTILRTEDGGKSWMDVPPFEDLVDVQFLNSKLGWIADGWIRKTIDSGENWEVQYADRDIVITGIYFADAQEGWAIGSKGKILTTKNGGATWERISSANEELRDIFFLNNREGWIVGGEEKSFILHTQNGGQTWSIKERNFTVPLKKVHFVNSKHGWAVGGVWRPGFRTGIILHTKDGMNWEQQLEVRPPLEGVHFVDENEGWVVGSGAAIFHTKDAGRNWERQNAGEINTHLTDVLFLDAQKGWIVGWDGLIIHTEDGGENWQIQRNSRQDNPFLSYYETLYDICYDRKSTLWAVGRNGLILKYTDPALEAYLVSTPTDKLKTTWGRIKNYLYQNYPNPFNSETWIPYQLASDSPVTIRIYNTKGQLIRTIALGHQTAGVYQSKDKAAYWDGKNDAGEEVASGVYFYTLQSGDFRANRRMLILK